MAARRKKAAKKAPKKSKGKAPKAKKEKKLKEPKVIKPGPPLESVLLLVTGLLLIGALLTLDFVKGRDYEEGMLFKGEYQAAK